MSLAKGRLHRIQAGWLRQNTNDTAGRSSSASSDSDSRMAAVNRQACSGHAPGKIERRLPPGLHRHRASDCSERNTGEHGAQASVRDQCCKVGHHLAARCTKGKLCRAGWKRRGRVEGSTYLASPAPGVAMGEATPQALSPMKASGVTARCRSCARIDAAKPRLARDGNCGHLTWWRPLAEVACCTLRFDAGRGVIIVRRRS